jgi:hypothetical protein
MKKKRFRVLVLILSLAGATTVCAGPYPPAAGRSGSTAVSKDSPKFSTWASGYVNYIVGANVDSTWRTPEKALGPAEGNSYAIVCLGDGGQITLTFDRPITNGRGWDFAVFENSFSDTYLELAYVEVSSDGTTFVRFDNDSLTEEPVGGFGALDPTDIDGLAGKYRQGFGTPFDLSALAGKPEVLAGKVDLSSITHVRIVDVIGDGSCFDTDGDIVYDPHPTAHSAGFDLDAVGVRYVQTVNSAPYKPKPVFPADNASAVALNVNLKSSKFKDPDRDTGDFHFRTQWQLATDDTFEDTVLDVVSATALRELRLSETILSASTSCCWRVRYFDGRGGVSPWSDAFIFRTVDESSDADGNGIPDAQELAPGSRIDLNNDQVPDVEQVDERFKVLLSAVGGGQMAIAVSNPNTVIEFVEAVESDDYPQGSGQPEDTPLGLLNLRLRVPNSGDSESVTVYFSKPAPKGYRWFKYDPIRGWRVDGEAEFSTDRRSVTFSLQDGGDKDGDGRTDGVILDPSGAGGSSPVQPPSSGDAGVGGGVCFIRIVADGAESIQLWWMTVLWAVLPCAVRWSRRLK